LISLLQEKMSFGIEAKQSKDLGSASFLPKALWQFQKDCLFTDLTIACSDGSVPAHKAMLGCVFRLLGMCGLVEEIDSIIIFDVFVLELEKALEELYLNSNDAYILKLIGLISVKSEICEEEIDEIEHKIDIDEYFDFDSHDKGDDPIDTKEVVNKNITTELKLKILKNNPLNAKNPLRPKHIQRIQQLSCDQCDHIARDVDRLIIHKNHQHQNLKHHCEFCEFKTAFKKSLENHRRDEHPDWKAVRRLKQLSCDQCEFVGKRPEALENHKKREHGVRYPCDQCGAEYLDPEKLEVHRRYKHEKILHYCEACSYQSFFKSAVAKHYKEQHTDQMFYCDQCSFSTKVQERIKIHVESKHEGKRHYCEQCEYSAPYRGGLVRHIKMKHEGIRYSCEFCDHSATTRSNLRLHVDAKHLGIKYSCDMCNYQASQPGSLKIHKQSQHGGAIPIPP